MAIFRGAADERFSSLKSTGYAGVKKVELCSFNSFARLTFFPNRNFARKKRVFKNLEIFLYCTAGDLRIRCDGLVIDLFSV